MFHSVCFVTVSHRIWSSQIWQDQLARKLQGFPSLGLSSPRNPGAHHNAWLFVGIPRIWAEVLTFVWHVLDHWTVFIAPDLACELTYSPWFSKFLPIVSWTSVCFFIFFSRKVLPLPTLSLQSTVLKCLPSYLGRLIHGYSLFCGQGGKHCLAWLFSSEPDCASSYREPFLGSSQTFLYFQARSARHSHMFRV